MARKRKSSFWRTERLDRPQVKIMLDFLGVDLNSQSKLTLSEMRSNLLNIETNDPDKFKEAYDLIVLHKTEKEGQTKVLPYSDASKLISEEAAKLESGAISKIENACTDKITEREANFRNMQKDFVTEAKSKMHEAIERESKKFNVTAIKIGTKKPKSIQGVTHEKLPRLLQLASRRKNILLVGPAGCGKTFIASQIADHLELRYGSQSCSAGVSETAFVGWLLPIGNSGKFVYVSSVFVDIYENGGVFLFDEIDNSDANVLVFLNQALANGQFFLPQRHENPLVKKHKDFIAVAAANTFGHGADSMYHGRIALDAATLDRFRTGTVFMDYSAAIEEATVSETVLSWGRNVREKISQHKLRKLLSTRVMQEATEMMQECDWTIGDIEEGYFADWTEQEKAMCGFNQAGG